MDIDFLRNNDFINGYPMDVIEAFVTIIIIRAIVDKPIEFLYVFKSSLVLGLLIYLADLLRDDYKKNVREGIRNSVGYFIFQQFVN
jgi:hypothetical protein